VHLPAPDDDLTRAPPPGPGPTAGAVSVRGLRHAYAGPAGPVPVLNGIDLTVAAGDHVALTGRSGAGKTTLLSVLGGLERPQEGRVEVHGHNLAGLDRDGLAAFRRETVGFVFQHFGLLDALTARENVELALALAGRCPRRQRSRQAGELLAAVGLEHRAGHRPPALSGGERQRVALARALANRPRLVLADEPTGNLDVGSAEVVLDLLERLPGEAGCTLVVVTHNREVAARAGRVLALEDGRIRGSTEDHPAITPAPPPEGKPEAPR
jgi:putative ABC transport system ATP-binding protein